MCSSSIYSPSNIRRAADCDRLSFRSAGSRPVRLSGTPTTRSLPARAAPDTANISEAPSNRRVSRRGMGNPPWSIKPADAMAGDEVIVPHLHQRLDDGRIVGSAQRAGHLAVVQLDR